MKKIALIAIIISSVYLHGCDFQGGLIRYADFKGSLNRDCVMKALNNIDEISNIKYFQPSRNSHQFDYEINGIRNFVQYQKSSFGYLRYWNGYFELNTVPKKEDLVKIYPYLLKIDKNIEKECKINILKHIDEDCSRMKCK